MPNDWTLYRELIRFGLRFCDDINGFKRLMQDQAETAAICREEAPEVAAEIRAMCEEVKSRLGRAV